MRVTLSVPHVTAKFAPKRPGKRCRQMKGPGAGCTTPGPPLGQQSLGLVQFGRSAHDNYMTDKRLPALHGLDLSVPRKKKNPRQSTRPGPLTVFASSQASNTAAGVSGGTGAALPAVVVRYSPR